MKRKLELMQFSDNSYVGAKACFKTKENFLQQVKYEFGDFMDNKENLIPTNVTTGYIRFYPRGLTDCDDFDPPYYSYCKKAKGAIPVWIVK